MPRDDANRIRRTITRLHRWDKAALARATKTQKTKTQTRTKKKTLWFAGGSIVTVAAVVATFFTVLSINRSGQFEQAIDAECAPLVVLAFRGSGEGNLTSGVTANAGEPYAYGDSALITNGWEGITLTSLFAQLAQTEHEGFLADQIPVVPLGPAGPDEPFGYDAIEAVLEASSLDSALSYSSSRLLHSASRGAEAATHLIRDYLLASAGCPILPKFVVTGYSQGAMAARHTAELNPESVLGVVKIGDPYQMPDAPGVRAEGAGGIGIIRWKADEEQGRQLDAYYGAPDLRSSICHAGDPICEFFPVEGLLKLATGNYGAHMDYYSGTHADEAVDDALEIAKIAAKRWRLARAAFDSGETVSWDDAGNAAEVTLRALSLSFAGTPTLFSAFTPDHLGANLVYEFDLDGDGVYETTSADGTVWVTFDEEGPHTIGVRVSDPDAGTSSTSTTTIEVAAEEDGQIVFGRDGRPIEGASAPSPAEEPATEETSAQVPPADDFDSAPAPSRPRPSTPPLDSGTPTEPSDPDAGEEEPGGTDPGEAGQPVFTGPDRALWPGEEVVITGSGLTPGTYVTVRSEDLFMAEAVVDEQGEVTIAEQIWQGTPGGHYDLVIEYESSTGESAERVLTIEVLDAQGPGPGDEPGEGEEPDDGEDPPAASAPVIDPIPGPVFPGQPIPITGSGFLPGEEVWFTGMYTRVDTPDGDGDLVSELVAPGTPGEYQVIVSYPTADGARQLSFSVQVIEPQGAQT